MVSANQNDNDKYGHAEALLLKVQGSYTSLAFYSNIINTDTKINTTSWFHIKKVLSNDNTHLSNFEQILDYNPNCATLKNINQHHLYKGSQVCNNNHSNTKMDESENLEVKKSKENIKHFLGLQSLEFKTNKNENYFNLNRDFLVDTLDLNIPNFNDKLIPRGTKLNTLKLNLLPESSPTTESKHHQSEPLHSKNNYRKPTPEIDFPHQEKLQNLSLYFNEDQFETNELDDILSVPQIEMVKLRPHIEAVKIKPHFVPRIPPQQGVQWTPLGPAVISGRDVQASNSGPDAQAAISGPDVQAAISGPDVQAVISGPDVQAGNLDRQDQQPTSGKIQLRLMVL